MSKTDFDAFVKRQQLAGVAPLEFDPQQRLREWLGYLDVLYTQIDGYLQTYIERDAVKIARSQVTLNEEFIGVYQASTATLTIGCSIVTFTPIGTFVIGGKGRVDVHGPMGKARLALVDKKVNDVRDYIDVMSSTRRAAGSSFDPRASRLDREPIEWVWKISTPAPETEFIALAQDEFFEMIQALVYE